MIIKLKNIADIHYGVYAKSLLPGVVNYLQAKHFDDNGILIQSLIPELPLNNKTQKHLLQHNDMLIAVKGQKNFATLYNSTYGKCVASSTFIVIRLYDNFNKTLLPQYLCWYINHPQIREWIKNRTSGSSTLSISISEMQELDIVIPSIWKQELILKTDALQRQELILKKKINDLNEKYLQYCLINAIKK